MSTGYLRDQRSPFWATALTKMDPNVANIVRGLRRVAQRSSVTKAHVWMGSGWRTGSSEHNSGRAIDIMFVPNGGTRPNAQQAKARNALVAWLMKHGKALRIQWILVSRDGKNRTESFNFDRGTWKSLENRHSISANHIDHVHVYFKTSARWQSSLDSTTMGNVLANVIAAVTPPKNTAPSTGAQRGDHIPMLYSSSNHPKGSSSGPMVRLLQSGLNRIFPSYRFDVSVGNGKLLTVDGWYGAQTDAWIKEFQSRTGLKVDGIVGKATEAKLKYYGVFNTTNPVAMPAKPVVSLSKVIQAAASDGKRKQGGVTPGAAEHVKIVEKALEKEGLLSSKYSSDGSFGTLTVSAYSNWQKSLGYSGKDADGIPGRKSLERLGLKHGFTVGS